MFFNKHAGAVIDCHPARLVGLGETTCLGERLRPTDKSAARVRLAVFNDGDPLSAG
jgi:hypothetical protein